MTQYIIKSVSYSTNTGPSRLVLSKYEPYTSDEDAVIFGFEADKKLTDFKLSVWDCPPSLKSGDVIGLNADKVKESLYKGKKQYSISGKFVARSESQVAPEPQQVIKVKEEITEITDVVSSSIVPYNQRFEVAREITHLYYSKMSMDHPGSLPFMNPHDLYDAYILTVCELMQKMEV